MGHLLLEIATTEALERAADEPKPVDPFIDTGLTPSELYKLCLTQLAQGWNEDPVTEAWAPIVVRGADDALQAGLFRFFVSIQEALGRVRVMDDARGEPRVFVTADVLSSARA
jgi:hypothetical protein